MVNWFVYKNKVINSGRLVVNKLIIILLWDVYEGIYIEFKWID